MRREVIRICDIDIESFRRLKHTKLLSVKLKDVDFDIRYDNCYFILTEFELIVYKEIEVEEDDEIISMFAMTNMSLDEISSIECISRLK